MAIPPEPPKTRAGFARGFVLGGLVVVLLGLVVYVVASIWRDQWLASEPSNARQPPRTETAQDPVESPAISGVVHGSFSDKGGASLGERISFDVRWLDDETQGCKTHSYTNKSKTHGAYVSDCDGWESRGYDVLFFYVEFENVSDHAVTLILRHLALQSRDGRTFEPVNVRAQADEDPTLLLDEEQVLPPGAHWRGWVSFDGRPTHLVAQSLSYVDGRQTLEQRFLGRESIS